MSSNPELCFDFFLPTCDFQQPTAKLTFIFTAAHGWLPCCLENPMGRCDWAMSGGLTGLYIQSGLGHPRNSDDISHVKAEEIMDLVGWGATKTGFSPWAFRRNGASQEFEFGAWDYWDTWRGGKERWMDEQPWQKRAIRLGGEFKEEEGRKTTKEYLPHQRRLLWALLFLLATPHPRKEITFDFHAFITSVPIRKNSLLSSLIHRAEQTSFLTPLGDSYHSS